MKSKLPGGGQNALLTICRIGHVSGMALQEWLCVNYIETLKICKGSSKLSCPKLNSRQQFQNWRKAS